MKWLPNKAKANSHCVISILLISHWHHWLSYRHYVWLWFSLHSLVCIGYMILKQSASASHTSHVGTITVKGYELDLCGQVLMPDHLARPVVYDIDSKSGGERKLGLETHWPLVIRETTAWTKGWRSGVISLGWDHMLHKAVRGCDTQDRFNEPLCIIGRWLTVTCVATHCRMLFLFIGCTFLGKIIGDHLWDSLCSHLVFLTFQTNRAVTLGTGRNFVWLGPMAKNVD